MSIEKDITQPKLDKEKLPRHLAIIMDGNGRWAKKHGKIRTFGHKKAVDIVRQNVETSAELGIEYLTLYTFSKENWQRPKSEVRTLMTLLVDAIKKEFIRLKENNIRLRVLGEISDLNTKTARAILDAVNDTSQNTGMVLAIALSYGAKEELRQMTMRLCQKAKNNEINIDDIDYDMINENLYTRKMPDVDLLIRTGGEQRISNFLLWQSAYAEFLFTETLWPDFKKEELLEALEIYQHRQRRFGKTSEQVQ